MATASSPGLVNWLLITSLGVSGGSAFMGVSLALEGMTPWWVAAGRTALAALILLAVGPLVGQGIGAIQGRRAWGVVALVGVVTTAVPITLLSWGLTQVPTAFAGVTMGAVPLLVLPLVAVFSRDEGIGPRRIGGVVLGFVGLAVLFGGDAFGAGTWAGRLACLGAAAGYAVGSILTRRAPPVPPVAFATGALVCGAVVLVPIAWVLEGAPRAETASAGWALLYTALFPTGLAAIMRVRVIKTAGSLFMSLTSYMVPLWAVLFGAVFMGEALPGQLFLALALILGGIGLSQSRMLGQQFRPTTKTQ